MKNEKRRRLPPERHGKTHSVKIGGVPVKIRTGEYKDGSLGEIFIELEKQGDELRVYDAVAIAISIGLQYGVPLEVFENKFRGQRLEPSGITTNKEIPMVASIIDYLAKWLRLKYLCK
jgi:ribonucleoside-diphosphate reductase alpha chain